MVEPADEWLVVTVRAPSDALKSAVAEGLVALGGTAVQEDGDDVTTYLPVPPDLPNWIERANASLRDSTGHDELSVSTRTQRGEDWTQLWKRGLGPRRVGKTFIVAPSWTAPERRANDRLIVVDPEMAFGTGEHATTRGALRFLEECIRPGDRVLDVGTGSGILAIGAAHLGAEKVTAVDLDPDALLNARDNIERNHVANVVTLEERAVDVQYLQSSGQPFDVIVANVLSGVLLPLLPAFFASLHPGGFVILGGILEFEADDLLEVCSSAGFQIIAEDLEEEWWGVLLRRPPEPR